MAAQKMWTINKDLLIYKSFYFFYFGAIGTLNPYLPVYLRQIGLSAFAVGLLVGVRPIIQLASAPFWTVVADKFRKRKSILVMSIMAWLIMTIALVFIEPTEEVCEFRATNLSHSVHVNYTTLKTGFFKRSDEDTWPTERLARTIQNTVKGGGHGDSLAVSGKKSSEFIKNSIDFSKFSRTHLKKNSDNQRHFLVFPPKHVQSDKNSPRVVAIKGNHSKIKSLVSNQALVGDSYVNSTRQDLGAKMGLAIYERYHKQRHLLSNVNNIHYNPWHKHPREILTDKDSGTTLTKSARSGQTFDSVVFRDGSKYTDLDLNNTQQGAIRIFDPYNMNGKDRRASAQLNKFLVSSQNTSINLPDEDARYFNMNGVESREKKRKKHGGNSTPITSKSSSRNFSRPHLKYGNKRKNISGNGTVTGKVIDIGLAMSADSGKGENNTFTITQKNLFKSNLNEMKRLFVILLVLIVVGEFLETPSSPLSDASLLEYLGEARIHYGKQRLWGSLGHGISSFVVGILLERSRHVTCAEEFIDYTICFCAFTLMMLATLVITANFKFKYKDVEEAKHSVLSTVLTIHYISFLSAACYMGMCHGLLHNFIMWFLEDLGGSKTLMGLAIGSRSSADLITFFVASQLIETIGQIKIVFVALISYGTIFIAYSTMTNPWFALAVEFLDGFTYAASWSACTSYLAEAAPQESVATMQGILQGVYWGMGTGIGAIMGGHLIHTVGANLTFRVAATGSFVVALLFAATQWKWQRENLDDSLGIYNYFSTGEPTDTEALLQEDLEDKINSTEVKAETKRKEKRGKSHKKHSRH